jgi:hypothetical protein
MPESEELKEQRKFERFFPKDLAFVVSEQFLFGVGTLLDISGGGVGFQYAYDSDEDQDLLKGSIRLDLFKSKPTRQVIGIEGNIVYDTVVPWEIGLFSNYQVRRCGVEFDQLVEDHFRELHSFLNDLASQENCQ